MRVMVALAGAALVLGGCSLLPAPTADVGDCVDLDVNSTSVEELEGFECSKEHDAEVYYKGDVEFDGGYDAAVIEQEAVDACLTGFEEFVGIEYFSSSLDVYYMYPEEEGWGAGDREVMCAVYTPDAAGEVTRTTGSLEGSEL
ncbi:septum formation family protein [Demequina sp.]|uniref:septum formation family protein n=1 Tax=Demequina sp. TaxID=2050685 RepID=UPI0025C4020D|nr:septum formation family protein [Demequina sp.]